MVLDTSAILAILLNEPERRAFNEAIEAAGGASCIGSFLCGGLDRDRIAIRGCGAQGIQPIR
jgi:hypothetical protein